MSDAAAHAAWLYRDCTRDGWGVFRIAESYTLEKGRKTWTEPELIQAIAAWMEHEAANNPQQRPETVQHTANRSSTRPRNKQKRSAISAGSNLQLHRRELGRTFVSQARLAKDLGISRQAVSRQVQKLLQLGYLVHARANSTRTRRRPRSK